MTPRRRSRSMYRPFDGIGSYSHGTIRTEDVGPAVLDMIEAGLRWQACRDRRNRYRALRAEWNRCDPETEQADDLLADLWDLAEECAPPGIYAGSTEGDGSDYGLWPYDPEDTDLPRLADPADLAGQPADVREAYTVTDHGNVTRWIRDGRGTWHVLWACV